MELSLRLKQARQVRGIAAFAKVVGKVD